MSNFNTNLKIAAVLGIVSFPGAFAHAAPPNALVMPKIGSSAVAPPSSPSLRQHDPRARDQPGAQLRAFVLVALVADNDCAGAGRFDASELQGPRHGRVCRGWRAAQHRA